MHLSETLCTKSRLKTAVSKFWMWSWKFSYNFWLSKSSYVNC